MDPKTNLVTDRITVGPEPRSVTAGANAIWTLNQGDGSVSRVNLGTRRVETIELGVPGSRGEIVFGGDSVWVSALDLPLSRIDPATNRVLRQWTGAGGDGVGFGHGSVWLSNPGEGTVWRIDPDGP